MSKNTSLKEKQASILVQFKASIYGTTKETGSPHGTMMGMITFYMLKRDTRKYIWRLPISNQSTLPTKSDPKVCLISTGTINYRLQLGRAVKSILPKLRQVKLCSFQEDGGIM